MAERKQAHPQAERPNEVKAERREISWVQIKNMCFYVSVSMSSTALGCDHGRNDEYRPCGKTRCPIWKRLRAHTSDEDDPGATQDQKRGQG